METEDRQTGWRDGWHTAGFLAAVAALILVPWLIPQLVEQGGDDWQSRWAQARTWSWVACALLVLAATAILGHGLSGRWSGLLIDNENRMSLPRLQVLLWTTIVVSGLFAAALSNLSAKPPAAEGDSAGDVGSSLDDRIERALNIDIPSEVWLLLGINAASFVGTAVVMQAKTKRNPTPLALERAGLTQNVAVSNEAELNVGVRRAAGGAPDAESGSGAERASPIVQWTSGVLLVNASPDQASFGDLFNGAEVGNAAYLDIGKVQMFFFTVITALVYAVAVGYAFASAAHIPFGRFPDIGEAVAITTAISQVGYLANLTASHTPTVP